MMSSARASLYVGLFATCACASAAPLPRDPTPAVAPVAVEPPAASPVPVDAGSPGSRSAKLRYELNGHSFPLPLVHGTIAGEPVWMLVDTGANSHVIASWVARKAGIALRPLGDVGSDHVGRAVIAYAADQPQVIVDDWGAVASGPMLVTDVPEPIARMGIGAFVSPQWLAEQGDGIVLDLASGEMRSVPWAEAVRALDERGGQSIAAGGVHLCEDQGSRIKGLAFVLRASIDGHKVQLLLDTGAYRTDLLTTSRTGRLLAGRSVPSAERTYAASGPVRTRLVRSAQIKVGQWAVTADIDLVPGVADPVCPRDGVVSMDALSSCMLVLGHKEVLGRCGASP